MLEGPILFTLLLNGFLAAKCLKTPGPDESGSLTSDNLDQLKDFSGFDGWGIFFFLRAGPIGAPGGSGGPPKAGRPGRGGGPPGGGGGGGGIIAPAGGGGGGGGIIPPGGGGGPGGKRGPPGGPGITGGPPGTTATCLFRKRIKPH